MVDLKQEIIRIEKEAKATYGKPKAVSKFKEITKIALARGELTKLLSADESYIHGTDYGCRNGDLWLAPDPKLNIMDNDPIDTTAVLSAIYSLYLHSGYDLSIKEVNEASTYERDNVVEVNHNNLIIWNNKIKSKKEELEIANHNLELAESNYDYEKAAVLKHGTIPKLQEELATLKFNNTNTLLTNLVDEEGVANIISKWTNIPVTKLVGSEKDKLLNLENNMKKRSIIIAIFFF